MPDSVRVRVRYLALMVGTIAIGLLVNRRGSALSPVVRDILGDALWAAMVVWALSVTAPAVSLRWRAAAALAVSWCVELSQLVHFPALDAARRTLLGQLALGSGFDPRDFVAYAAGVVAAMLIDTAMTRLVGHRS
jgi:hypothetical protein